MYLCKPKLVALAARFPQMFDKLKVIAAQREAKRKHKMRHFLFAVGRQERTEAVLRVPERILRNNEGARRISAKDWFRMRPNAEPQFAERQFTDLIGCERLLTSGPRRVKTGTDFAHDKDIVRSSIVHHLHDTLHDAHTMDPAHQAAWTLQKFVGYLQHRRAFQGGGEHGEASSAAAKVPKLLLQFEFSRIRLETLLTHPIDVAMSALRVDEGGMVTRAALEAWWGVYGALAPPRPPIAAQAQDASGEQRPADSEGVAPYPAPYTAYKETSFRHTPRVGLEAGRGEALVSARSDGGLGHTRGEARHLAPNRRPAVCPRALL